jgi:hypothetical protein
MTETLRIIGLLLLILLWGCAIRRKVETYNAHTTADCLKHHTSEQCKPLSYPACEPGSFGGVECR